MKNNEPKTKKPPVQRDRKADPEELNQATSAEFEREGMGVAPKE
jgi:hypothetical protein